MCIRDSVIIQGAVPYQMQITVAGLRFLARFIILFLIAMPVFYRTAAGTAGLQRPILLTPQRLVYFRKYFAHQDKILQMEKEKVVSKCIHLSGATRMSLV